MNRSVILFLASWLMLPLVPPEQAPAAPTGSDGFRFEGNCVSMKGSQVDVMSVLEMIAESAAIQILLFDPIRAPHAQLELEREPLDRALKYLLKGHSYAVVYSNGKGPYGVHVISKGAVSNFAGPEGFAGSVGLDAKIGTEKKGLERLPAVTQARVRQAIQKAAAGKSNR